jgi:hypothetical protein
MGSRASSGQPPGLVAAPEGSHGQVAAPGDRQDREAGKARPKQGGRRRHGRGKAWRNGEGGRQSGEAQNRDRSVHDFNFSSIAAAAKDSDSEITAAGHGQDGKSRKAGAKQRGGRDGSSEARRGGDGGNEGREAQNRDSSVHDFNFSSIAAAAEGPDGKVTTTGHDQYGETGKTCPEQGRRRGDSGEAWRGGDGRGQGGKAQNCNGLVHESSSSSIAAAAEDSDGEIAAAGHGQDGEAGKTCAQQGRRRSKEACEARRGGDGRRQRREAQSGRKFAHELHPGSNADGAAT